MSYMKSENYGRITPSRRTPFFPVLPLAHKGKDKDKGDSFKFKESSFHKKFLVYSQ